MAKSTTRIVNSTTARTTVTAVKKTTDLVFTYIRGSGIEVNEDPITNYPLWFWYIIAVGCCVCCLSCMAWVVCALCFFKREKKCTHTLHVVVEKDPEESPKRGSKSPKKEKDEQLESPGGAPMENGSFTNPLQPSDYGRSSKRSSRKEEEPKKMEAVGGGNGDNSRKSSSKKSQKNEPESRKSSKKSSKKDGSKKSGSRKSNSKKSIKSERLDGGKDFGTTFSIQMDSDDNFQNSQQFGFFEKISRSIFQPRQ